MSEWTRLASTSPRTRTNPSPRRNRPWRVPRASVKASSSISDLPRKFQVVEVRPPRHVLDGEAKATTTQGVWLRAGVYGELVVDEARHARDLAPIGRRAERMQTQVVLKCLKDDIAVVVHDGIKPEVKPRA